MATLTEKQRKFVLYYEGNATEAATKAGYSPKTAYAQGHTLLKHIEIKKALNTKRDKQESKHWGRQELMDFWTTMAKEAEGDNNRLKASELLAKAEAMFVQRVEDVTNYNDLTDEDAVTAGLDEIFAKANLKALFIGKLAAMGYKVIPIT